MKLIERITGRGETRDGISLQDLVNSYMVGGNAYSLMQTYQHGKYEVPSISEAWRNAGTYKGNGVVFACVLARLSLFSEARFQFRRIVSGRPGDLFGDKSLSLLERPDRNVTTGGLLARMEQDSSLAGNAYNARVGDRVVRLRPDWVTVVLGSPNGMADDPSEDPEVELAGYLYSKPGNVESAHVFLPDEVSHFAPTPDPFATFRGMSWLTTVLREIEADDAATNFKNQWFANSATPNMVVTVDKTVNVEEFKKIKDVIDEGHTGPLNAFKTLYLGGGADAKVVGANFEQMSFKAVQAAGETRVAAAAGVPPVIVGLSEGLSSATYSNYSQARRRFADGTARPWWREAAASLETIVPPPVGAQLWYDDRDIAFLRDDAKDVAEIQSSQAQAIRTLIDAGWKPDAAVDAVIADDMARLTGNHTGLTSAQLLPPGPTNGSAGATSPNTPTPPKTPPPARAKPIKVRNLSDPLEDAIERLALPAGT